MQKTDSQKEKMSEKVVSFIEKSEKIGYFY